jgi:hypothetical protein
MELQDHRVTFKAIDWLLAFLLTSNLLASILILVILLPGLWID